MGQSSKIERVSLAFLTSSWLALGFLIWHLWYQFQNQVDHPDLVATLVALIVYVVAQMGALGYLILRFREAPVRIFSIGALAPSVTIAGLAIYALSVDLRIFDRMGLKFVGDIGGASLVMLHAHAKYPNRLESEKVVMLFDQLKTASDDLQKMNEHVSEMEKTWGLQRSSPIFWIRGSALGLNGLSWRGTALGTRNSPQSWSMPMLPPLDRKQLDSEAIEDQLKNHGLLDRHEVAHIVLNRFSNPKSDPPALFDEGWAMLNMGLDRSWLRASALLDQPNSPKIKDLLSPRYYHGIGVPNYILAGSFTDFLISQIGFDKFLSFYFSTMADSVLSDLKALTGSDIDVIESNFWESLRGDKA
jgi:hypothetical protein